MSSGASKLRTIYCSLVDGMAWLRNTFQVAAPINEGLVVTAVPFVPANRVCLDDTGLSLKHPASEIPGCACGTLLSLQILIVNDTGLSLKDPASEIPGCDCGTL